MTEPLNTPVLRPVQLPASPDESTCVKIARRLRTNTLLLGAACVAGGLNTGTLIREWREGEPVALTAFVVAVFCVNLLLVLFTRARLLARHAQVHAPRTVEVIEPIASMYDGLDLTQKKRVETMVAAIATRPVERQSPESFAAVVATL